MYFKSLCVQLFLSKTYHTGKMIKEAMMEAAMKEAMKSSLDGLNNLRTSMARRSLHIVNPRRFCFVLLCCSIEM